MMLLPKIPPPSCILHTITHPHSQRKGGREKKKQFQLSAVVAQSVLVNMRVFQKGLTCPARSPRLLGVWLVQVQASNTCVYPGLACVVWPTLRTLHSQGLF